MIKRIVQKIFAAFNLQISRRESHKDLHRGRVINLPSLYKNYVLECRKGSSDYMVYKQVFERNEYRLFKQLAEQLPRHANDGLTILDAGANVGFASLFFSASLNVSKIIAVEPDRNNFEALKKNIHTNKLDECIIPVNYAIWSSNEMLEFHRDFRDGEDWSVAVRKATSQSNQQDKVAGRTVNSILKEFANGHIDIIKMDIEGGEAELFKDKTAAFELLSYCKMIFIEIHEEVISKSVIKQFLNEAGFLTIDDHEFTIGIKK